MGVLFDLGCCCGESIWVAHYKWSRIVHPSRVEADDVEVLHGNQSLLMGGLESAFFEP